ncbi:MAG: hypothetical protein WBB23_16880 [Desulforhopalus sp.]
MTDEQIEAIENEWHIVRYSGETPEIAYNSAIYYLTRAKDGPHIHLSEQHILWLKEAAVERYTEIILRDLQHSNSTKSIYRGVGRSIVNYQRYCVFCSRQQLQTEKVRDSAAEALLIFLETESAQLHSGKKTSIINCTYKELVSYGGLLGLDLGRKYEILKGYCGVSLSC